MALNPLSQLPSGSVVVVDSAPIIYFLEDRRLLADRYAPVFSRAAEGDIGIVISTITLAEVLCGPLAAGHEALAEQYRIALTEGNGWTVHSVTDTLAVTAARVRVKYRLRLPDAIQLATVIEAGGYALITHDRDFRRVRDVRILS